MVTKEKKKARRDDHSAIRLAGLILVLVLLLVGSITIINNTKELEDNKRATAELLTMMAKANAACQQYANLTDEQLEDVIFDYFVAEIKDKNDQSVGDEEN